MPARRVALWAVLAIAGLLVAVALTTAATELTSQRIGLQSEPISAGDDLAPPRRAATPQPTATPEDDDRGHGRGRGRGRGRGGDDD